MTVRSLKLNQITRVHLKLNSIETSQGQHKHTQILQKTVVFRTLVVKTPR